jgi:hypothetical protein
MQTIDASVHIVKYKHGDKVGGCATKLANNAQCVPSRCWRGDGQAALDGTGEGQINCKKGNVDVTGVDCREPSCKERKDCGLADVPWWMWASGIGLLLVGGCGVWIVCFGGSISAQFGGDHMDLVGAHTNMTVPANHCDRGHLICGGWLVMAARWKKDISPVVGGRLLPDSPS